MFFYLGKIGTIAKKKGHHRASKKSCLFLINRVSGTIYYE